MVPLASASGYIVIGVAVTGALVLLGVLLRNEDRQEAEEDADGRR